MSATYTWKGTIAATAIVTLYPDTSGNFWADGGNNDEVEINAAASYVIALGGGSVFLGRATFYISAPIIINGAIYFVGSSKLQQGYGTTIRLADNSNCDMIDVTDSGITTYFTAVKHLTLYGNKTNQASGQGIYIHGDIHDCLVEDVFVTTIKDIGIYIYGGHNHEVRESWIEYCDDEGVYINDSGQCKVTENYFASNLRHIRAYSAANLQILSNQGVNSGNQSIQIEVAVDTTDFQIIGNHFRTSNVSAGNFGFDIQALRGLIIGNRMGEGTTTHSLYLDPDTDYVLVSDNDFSDSRGYGIRIDAGATRNWIKDNYLYNNDNGAILDNGTDTILATINGEFNQYGGGSAGRIAPVINTSPGGLDVDANDEFVDTRIPLGREIQQVVRIVVWAYSQVDEADRMRLRIVAHGATDNEAWSGNPIDVPNHPSESVNFSNLDVIYWIIDATDDAQIGTLAANDYVELLACGEVAGDGDCLTDALFGGYEVQYV